MPEMDRPSIALARVLDAVTIEEEDDTLGPPGSIRLVLACQSCGDSICDVETGDTVRVLFNTALAHVCT